MPDVPMPIKVVLGLAATAADEAKRLPETLPNAATTLPILAVSTALQASMRIQQRMAVLAVRGESLLAQLRGTTDEPPDWATFDDAQDSGKTQAPPRAAFDRIDYEGTGFAEGDDGERRWDAVGAGSDQDVMPASRSTDPSRSKPTAKAAPAQAAAPAKKAAAVKRTSAKKAAPATLATGAAARSQRKPAARTADAGTSDAGTSDAGTATAGTATARKPSRSHVPSRPSSGTRRGAGPSLADDLAAAMAEPTEE